jgi:hypothetical protein
MYYLKVCTFKLCTGLMAFSGIILFLNLFFINSYCALSYEQTSDYSYDLKKVAVMRFENKCQENLAVKFQDRITELFYSQGYYTIEPRKVRKAEWVTNSYNSSRLSPEQVKDLAQELKVDLIVGGLIQEYEGKKDFRGGNLIAFPVGLGFVLYGKISMKAMIYDGISGQKIWENEIVRHKKNFLGGLYQGRGAVLDKALSTALNRIFSSFFRKDF